MAAKRRRFQRSRATATSARSIRPRRMIARGSRSRTMKNETAPISPALRALSILSVSLTERPSESATIAVASAIAIGDREGRAMPAPRQGVVALVLPDGRAPRVGDCVRGHSAAVIVNRR